MQIDYELFHSQYIVTIVMTSNFAYIVFRIRNSTLFLRRPVALLFSRGTRACREPRKRSPRPSCLRRSPPACKTARPRRERRGPRAAGLRSRFGPPRMLSGPRKFAIEIYSSTYLTAAAGSGCHITFAAVGVRAERSPFAAVGATGFALSSP